MSERRVGCQLFVLSQSAPGSARIVLIEIKGPIRS
jgi:hypothetical protein